MPKVIHRIDPKADTVIVLKHPLVHFTAWNYPNIEESDVKEIAPCEETAPYDEVDPWAPCEKTASYDEAVPCAPCEKTASYDEAVPCAPCVEAASYDEVIPCAPCEETPALSWPADEIPAENVPAQDGPAAEVPAWPLGDTPIEETPPWPPEEAPADTLDASDWRVEDPSVPVSEGPIEEAPTEEPFSKESAVGSNVLGSSGHEEEIYYFVSSSHLRLASSRFESILSGENWKEGIRNYNDGLYRISTQDWDGEAFLILINALHLRSRQIPRSVSLVMLAKIAVLVDYYKCAEAVELSTEMWVKQLKDTAPIPSKYCRDLILWMCIACVLRLPEEFAQTTAVAIKHSKQEQVSTLDLPITGIAAAINEGRSQAIGAIVSQLHDLLDEYRNPNYACPNSSYSFECGSILYGALTKGMDSLGLSIPNLAALSLGMSFWEIYLKVRNVKSPTWSHRRHKSQHPCNLTEKVKKIADWAMDGVNGLDLKNFE